MKPPRRGTMPAVASPPSHHWHDPLRLIRDEAPASSGRIVLWSVCALTALMLAWAAFGQLDIVATAEGRLVPQTLVKVVQPAEAGVLRELLVAEGERVAAGQVLARLDATVAQAERRAVAGELAATGLHARRIDAALAGVPMVRLAGDEPGLFALVAAQCAAQAAAQRDRVAQEESQLARLAHERVAAQVQLRKLEQTLPDYERTAAAYARLHQDGFMGGLAAVDKARQATEKAHDLQAQRAAVAALAEGIAAQRQRIGQLHSGWRSELHRERAELRARGARLQADLERGDYRAGLTALRAPQAGVIKDLATTTPGAVLQPGTTLMTLVPPDALYADVGVRNEDVGFTRVGQRVQLKLAAYPFQRHGLLTGQVVHLGLDAGDAGSAVHGPATAREAERATLYRARVRLDGQTLRGPDGAALPLTAGMQVVAELHQGRRSVLDYLLSPLRKVSAEAARER